MIRTHFSILLTMLLFACCGPEHATTEPQPNRPTTTEQMNSDPSEPDSNPTGEPNRSDSAPDGDAQQPKPRKQLATLGGGCFWCTEAVLEQVEGVFDVESGYMGGHVDNPTYKQVCSGTTNHAEVVQVTFDPELVSYELLLEWFFKSHDPTTRNRQGADVGTQYRSVVFFHSPEQEKVARQVIERLAPNYGSPIVTEVTKAPKFWPAEADHQDFYSNNTSYGYCRAVIAPKLKKLELDVNGHEASKK